MLGAGDQAASVAEPSLRWCAADATDVEARALNNAVDFGRTLIARLVGSGLLVVDSELRVILAEGDAQRGFDRAAAVGRPVREVLPAPAWDVLEPRYLAALGGSVQRFEYDATDGTTHSLRFVPVIAEGSVVGVTVISRDITAEVAATRRLEASERLQSSVLNVLDEGILVMDRDGRLLRANAAASRILHFDLAGADPGGAWWAPFAPRRRDNAAPLEVGRGVMESGVGVTGVEVTIDGPGGEMVALSLNYLPLRDAMGAVCGLVLSFRDVSDHERERGALLELKERLSEAHDVAGLSSWEWQPETNDVVIVHAMAGAGFQAGERATLDDLMSVLPEDQRESMLADLAACASGELDEAVTRHSYTLHGRPGWIESRWRALRDPDGHLLHVRGTSQDVTESELARRELAAARELLQGTLDSLSAHIAVLDEAGRDHHDQPGVERVRPRQRRRAREPRWQLPCSVRRGG